MNSEHEHNSECINNGISASLNPEVEKLIDLLAEMIVDHILREEEDEDL